MKRRTVLLFAWVLGAMVALAFCQGCAGLTYNRQEQWNKDGQTFRVNFALSLLPSELVAQLQELPPEQLVDVLKAAFAAVGSIHFEPHLEFRQEQGTEAQTTQDVSADIRAQLAQEIKSALEGMKE